MSDNEEIETEEGATKVPVPAVAPTTAVQRESDRAMRPGFRNPPNARSKAQKTAKKGKNKK